MYRNLKARQPGGGDGGEQCKMQLMMRLKGRKETGASLRRVREEAQTPDPGLSKGSLVGQVHPVASIFPWFTPLPILVLLSLFPFSVPPSLSCLFALTPSFSALGYAAVPPPAGFWRSGQAASRLPAVT